MAEALAKKKRIRAGHGASATRTTREVEDIFSSQAPDKERLALLGFTFNEKLETIKTLDSEVIELIENEETLAAEIEQAENYKESIFSALIGPAPAMFSNARWNSASRRPTSDPRCLFEPRGPSEAPIALLRWRPDTVDELLGILRVCRSGGRGVVRYRKVQLSELTTKTLGP